MSGRATNFVKTGKSSSTMGGAPCCLFEFLVFGHQGIKLLPSLLFGRTCLGAPLPQSFSSSSAAGVHCAARQDFASELSMSSLFDVDIGLNLQGSAHNRRHGGMRLKHSSDFGRLVCGCSKKDTVQDAFFTIGVHYFLKYICILKPL